MPIYPQSIAITELSLKTTNPIVGDCQGGSPARKDFRALRAGFRALAGGDQITEKDEDRGLWLAGLALVLEATQLLLELLK